MITLRLCCSIKLLSGYVNTPLSYWRHVHSPIVFIKICITGISRQAPHFIIFIKSTNVFEKITQQALNSKQQAKRRDKDMKERQRWKAEGEDQVNDVVGQSCKTIDNESACWVSAGAPICPTFSSPYFSSKLLKGYMAGPAGPVSCCPATVHQKEYLPSGPLWHLLHISHSSPPPASSTWPAWPSRQLRQQQQEHDGRSARSGMALVYQADGGNTWK